MDVVEYYNTKVFRNRLILTGQFESTLEVEVEVEEEIEAKIIEKGIEVTSLDRKGVGLSSLDSTLNEGTDNGSRNGDSDSDNDNDMCVKENMKRDSKSEISSTSTSTVIYSIYQASDVSPEQLKSLQRIHQEKILSASLLLKSYGMAKLTVSNYIPTKQNLENIFFSDTFSGIEPSVNGSLPLPLPISREIEELPKQEIFYFLENKDHNKSILEFDRYIANKDTSKDAEENIYRENLLSGDDKLDERVKQREGEGVVIDDIPLGVRLINSYRSANNDKIMRVPEKFKVISPITAWKTVPGLSPNGTIVGSPIMVVYLPKHSVSAVVIHQGSQAMYAVAYTSLIVGVTERNVVMSGVTILPPGYLWLCIAISCLGCDVDDILSYESQYCDVPLYDFSSCSVVKDYMSSLLVVTQDEYLINAVNYLFKSWI